MLAYSTTNTPEDGPRQHRNPEYPQALVRTPVSLSICDWHHVCVHAMIGTMKNLFRTALLVAGLVMANQMPVQAVTLVEVAGLIGNAPLVAGTDKPVGALNGRVVVVTFFASWCPPCRKEFEHLNDLMLRVHSGQVAVLGINQFEAWGGKDDPPRLARFLADTDPQFALIEGSETLRLAFGDIERIPSIVVIGADGREVWRFVHQRGSTKTHATADELMAALAAAGVELNQ